MYCQKRNDKKQKGKEDACGIPREQESEQQQQPSWTPHPSSPRGAQGRAAMPAPRTAAAG